MYIILSTYVSYNLFSLCYTKRFTRNVEKAEKKINPKTINAHALYQIKQSHLPNLKEHSVIVECPMFEYKIKT